MCPKGVPKVRPNAVGHAVDGLNATDSEVMVSAQMRNGQMPEVKKVRCWGRLITYMMGAPTGVRVMRKT